MAASLGPWIVLLAGLLLDPGLRRRLGWRRAWPVIPPVAGGCLLLALSESGSTFALMAALLVICAERCGGWFTHPPALAVGHGGPGPAIGGLGAQLCDLPARFQQPERPDR